MAVASGSSKTVSNNRAQDSFVYDSDIDSAVYNIHIDSSYLYPGYKPNHKHPRPSTLPAPASKEEERRRRRNTAPEEEQEKAKRMSSATPTPSPPRPPPPSSNSSDSSTSEDVPRKLFRSYPSFKHKVREGSTVDEREIRRFRKEGGERILGASFVSSGAGAGAGRTRYGGAGGEDGHVQLEKGYDGDVEMEDVASDTNGSHADHGEVERGGDGDIEMGDVMPPHEAKGANSGSTNGFGRSDLPVKQTEGGNNKSKKRVRFSDQGDEEEEKVEHGRGRKWRKSEVGSRDSCQ